MTPTTSFADLLRSAVTEPGIIASADSQFHRYSLGNQLLAWRQRPLLVAEPGSLECPGDRPGDGDHGGHPAAFPITRQTCGVKASNAVRSASFAVFVCEA